MLRNFKVGQVTGMIELEIKRPHVIGARGYLTLPRVSGGAIAPSFPFFHNYL